MTILLALTVISLWPQGAPGPKSSTEHEANTTTATDKQVAGKPVVRLGPVTEPTLTFYPASQANGSAPVVLVFPGGGYRILAFDLEGEEVCQWLNRVGYAAALVKYRVGPPGGATNFQQPLADARQALALVRSHASEWKVDAKKMGTLGFSAGGHLAAMLNATSSKAEERPQFTVLIYPAYMTEVAAPGGPTPTIIVQTEDDRSFIDGTLAYYKTLKAAGMPVEMHLFSEGGHGYGLRATGDAVAQWPLLVENWLRHVLPRT